MSKILKSDQVQPLKLEPLQDEIFNPLKSFLEPQEPETQDQESLEGSTILEEEIEKLKTQAYKEAYRKGFEQGRAEGFEKGYAEGRALAEKELQEEKARMEKEYHQKLKEIDSFWERLQQSLAETVLDLDREVLSIINQVSEKFLFKSLEDPELILRVVREALKEVVEGARVTIRVHPKDTEILKDRELNTLSSKNFAHLEIKPDPGISPGGCLLETSFGLVDATVEKRWEEILKALEEASKSES